MKSFRCVCGSATFFDNTHCVSCGRELGWCPACSTLSVLLSLDDGAFQCAEPNCGARLIKCHNYEVEEVCNRCCFDSGENPDRPFCDYCRYNRVIPNLSIDDNRTKWGRLEAAKRRLMYTLDLLGLPHGNEYDGVEPPLSFDFKQDMPPMTGPMGELTGGETVVTGHANGKITINLREADPVELEAARVEFSEAHRTIIGHFRHEIGHYYWQMLVEDQCEADFIAIFGNYRHPDYDTAHQRYYNNGPPPDWHSHYISAYATMHPWEDFAETFATYLDIVSVLDTALHLEVSKSCDPTQAELGEMIEHYVQLGIVLNEMNRTMGLKDLVPEVFSEPIIRKMGFVHDLVRHASRYVRPSLQ